MIGLSIVGKKTYSLMGLWAQFRDVIDRPILYQALSVNVYQASPADVYQPELFRDKDVARFFQPTCITSAVPQTILKREALYALLTGPLS
jgi:hypothetical protein